MRVGRGEHDVLDDPVCLPAAWWRLTMPAAAAESAAGRIAAWCRHGCKENAHAGGGEQMQRRAEQEQGHRTFYWNGQQPRDDHPQGYARRGKHDDAHTGAARALCLPDFSSRSFQVPMDQNQG